MAKATAIGNRREGQQEHLWWWGLAVCTCRATENSWGLVAGVQSAMCTRATESLSWRYAHSCKLSGGGQEKSARPSVVKAAASPLHLHCLLVSSAMKSARVLSGVSCWGPGQWTMQGTQLWKLWGVNSAVRLLRSSAQKSAVATTSCTEQAPVDCSNSNRMADMTAPVPLLFS